MIKKEYSTPKIAVFGDATKLTLQGGQSFTDVPIGTPAGNVTGDNTSGLI